MCAVKCYHSLSDVMGDVGFYVKPTIDDTMEFFEHHPQIEKVGPSKKEIDKWKNAKIDSTTCKTFQLLIEQHPFLINDQTKLNPNKPKRLTKVKHIQRDKIAKYIAQKTTYAKILKTLESQDLKESTFLFISSTAMNSLSKKISETSAINRKFSINSKDEESSCQKFCILF